MSDEAGQETFEALFALTDLRQIFRETKPTYQLSDEQLQKVKEIIEKVRHSADVIEKELVK